MVIDVKQSASSRMMRSDIMTIYCNDMRRYPLLGRMEEETLIKEAQQNNDMLRKARATERLVGGNQRIVLAAAKRMGRPSMVMDLVNEGNMGLLVAIRRFDTGRNVHFITYAMHWIRKYMTEYLARHRNAVTPANASKLYAYVNSTKEEYFKENGRYPTLTELGEELNRKYGISQGSLSDFETYRRCSIDDVETREDEFSGSIAEYNRVTSTNNVDEYVERNDLSTRVEAMMGMLTDKERKVVSEIYGIGCEKKSYDAIAKEEGLTAERIRQILRKAMAKMKKMPDPRSESMAYEHISLEKPNIRRHISGKKEKSENEDKG